VENGTLSKEYLDQFLLDKLVPIINHKWTKAGELVRSTEKYAALSASLASVGIMLDDVKLSVQGLPSTLANLSQQIDGAKSCGKTGDHSISGTADFSEGSITSGVDKLNDDVTFLTVRISFDSPTCKMKDIEIGNKKPITIYGNSAKAVYSGAIALGFVDPTP
jgi:hypothetical protein